MNKNVLETVRIKSLWGERSLECRLHPDVNFLIGINGSGKTTVINLIAAALNADFATLDTIDFRSIEIQLSEVDGRRKPIIMVTKRRQPRSPFRGIKYAVKDMASGEAIDYSLDTIEEQFAIREHGRVYPAIFEEHQRGLSAHLRKLVNISWLSVYRKKYSRRVYRDDRGFESSVDEKLVDLTNDLVRLFSSLSRRAAKGAEEFLTKVFLSLLSTQRDDEVFRDALRLPLSEERDALAQVFREFNVPETEFKGRLGGFFKRTGSAVSEAQKDTVLSVEQFSMLVAALRIHSVVQEWKDYVTRRQRIFETRDVFIAIVNDHFHGKSVSINESNELLIRTSSGRKIALAQLSSGEKQLLIILGEALLQSRVPWVYIADEPELSLHVEWQEQLIRNLRRLNPSAQILFATHSPDIVSEYGDHYFDVESLFS